jgi:DNA-binding XRE family transcriptional regulator
MFYKLDTTNTPKTRQGWGANKINFRIARKIRETYNGGDISQSKIADIFGLSRRMVNLIVNNKAWTEADVGLRGSAEVWLRFSYEAGTK